MWNRLTCVTAAAAIATVAEAKRNSRVDFADHDALFGELIAAAQAGIEGPKGIGEALGPSTWRLSLDCWAPTIEIALGPVTDVTEVKYVDAAGAEQTLVADVDYLVDLDKRPARIVPAYGKGWPTARPQPGAIKITFEAGPADPDAVLKRAVLMLVSHWYEHPEAVGKMDLEALPFGVRWIIESRAARVV